MTQKSEPYRLAASAKRLIRNWANHYGEDVEFLVKHRDVADLPNAKRKDLYSWMGEIAGYVRRGFEATDPYERDWFLFMARYKNAVYSAPLGPEFATRPGVVPMAKDSELDRALSLVQMKLAHKMAICKRKGCQTPCYFRGGKKYCSRRCAKIVILAGKRDWFSRVGSDQRRIKRRSD